jgi:NAD(P)-dependent dehydrogenase (short-subunit alcohol dehydrogenase family)
VAQEIAVSGGNAVVVLGDLSDDEAAAQVAEKALSVFGGIDILVNNAGPSLRATGVTASQPNGSTCTTRTSARWCV